MRRIQLGMLTNRIVTSTFQLEKKFLGVEVESGLLGLPQDSEYVLWTSLWHMFVGTPGTNFCRNLPCPTPFLDSFLFFIPILSAKSSSLHFILFFSSLGSQDHTIFKLENTFYPLIHFCSQNLQCLTMLMSSNFYNLYT